MTEREWIEIIRNALPLATAFGVLATTITSSISAIWSVWSQRTAQAGKTATEAQNSALEAIQQQAVKVEESVEAVKLAADGQPPDDLVKRNLALIRENTELRRRVERLTSQRTETEGED